MDLGILLFAGAVVFSVITLPVEFNASRRALVLLEQRGFLNKEELLGARQVLSAAALTYVASTAMPLSSFCACFCLDNREIDKRERREKITLNYLNLG